MQKTITGKELSKILNVNYNVLHTVLCRFGKYLVSYEAARYKYKYTKEFLTDLKKWYEYKMENCAYNRYYTFSNAVKTLEKMIKEIKNDK